MDSYEANTIREGVGTGGGAPEGATSGREWTPCSALRGGGAIVERNALDLLRLGGGGLGPDV